MTPRIATSTCDLLTELARIEDALRQTPTFLSTSAGAVLANPETRRLTDRAEEIVRALRAR